MRAEICKFKSYRGENPGRFGHKHLQNSKNNWKLILQTIIFTSWVCETPHLPNYWVWKFPKCKIWVSKLPSQKSDSGPPTNACWDLQIQIKSGGEPWLIWTQTSAEFKKQLKINFTNDHFYILGMWNAAPPKLLSLEISKMQNLGLKIAFPNEIPDLPQMRAELGKFKSYRVENSGLSWHNHLQNAKNNWKLILQTIIFTCWVGETPHLPNFWAWKGPTYSTIWLNFGHQKNATFAFLTLSVSNNFFLEHGLQNTFGDEKSSKSRQKDAWEARGLPGRLEDN